MKIRILSDLHIDINNRSPLELDDKEIFTIVAGDTANNVNKSIDWVQKNVKRGIVIAGNHLVYESKGEPIESLKLRLAEAFPLNAPVTFLDCMVGTTSKEIDNILFVGTTLYTDYRLLSNFPDDYVKTFATGPYGMNDFDLGYTYENDMCHKRHLEPSDYQYWFIESKKEIMKAVIKNPDKEIVLITHHCPSARCCQNPHDLYNDGLAKKLQPSYASNLEPFIQAHPNIKLWICGHAHYRQNFKVGSCLVMMNPRGYDVEAYNFNPNTFVETKNWTCFQELFHNHQQQNEQRQELKRMMEKDIFSL